MIGPASRPGSPRVQACERCLRRTHLLAGIAACLEIEWRRARRTARVLALPDEVLIALDPSGMAQAAYRGFDPARARREIGEAGLWAVCRCSPGYPDRLRQLPDPPAVLHVAGAAAPLYDVDGVAIVGARRATPYGLEVARAMGRGLAKAGVVVVSGMALGVDSVAHEGALAGIAAPVAVLAGGADVAYPARMRGLHARIAGRGAVVSEMPPGFRAFRWCFVARNRIIAALAGATVIVEAATRSGSLTTADFAAELGRTVAAVPGPVTSPLSAGANALIAAGAALVTDARDVVELIGGCFAEPERSPAVELADPLLREVLDHVGRGRGVPAAITAEPTRQRAVLAALTQLELLGLVRRGFAGEYVRAG